MNAKITITLLLLACALASPASAMGSKPKLDRVEVTESMRACQTHNDCVQKDRGCNGCCDYDAIAKKQEPVFNKAYHAACADYKGSVCDCEDPDHKKPACIDHRCVMVKPHQPRQ